ncbi:MAG TPA: hypothetical protein VNL77_12170, partial [Roseiflexaceae bacterium]|nr:hypothetical protein [Roseiflexaceae bacterium]
FNRRAMRLRAPRGQDLLEAAEREDLGRARYEALVRDNRSASLAAVRAALEGFDFLMTFNTYAAFNMAGVPLLSLPAGRLPSGEPAALRLAAGLGRDGELLLAGAAFALAAQAIGDRR